MKYEPVSSRLNQLGNAMNPHQGKAIKALCVCSAGLLRSPTIAKELTLLGYNTRACGTSQDYALVPLSTALLTWADEIHVVEEQAELVRFCLEDLDLDDIKVVTYDIPDEFGTFDPKLVELIKQQIK